MDRKRFVGTLLLMLLIAIFETSLSTSKFSAISNSHPDNSQSVECTNSYDNVTTHEGDLIIDGTQTYVIENCTYVQTGNIYIRDWAKLVIRDSELYFNQTYPMQYNPTFGDYSTLEVGNSTLVSYQALNIDFKEHSEANFNDVTLNLSFSSWVEFYDFSKATIHQSTFSYWNCLLFDGYSEASITNSTVTQIQVAEVGTCEIEISNSTVHCIAMIFGPSQIAKIDHLLPGLYEYMSLQEAVTASGVPCKMTLNNTLVEAWAVHVYYDTETQISDSIISERLGICIQGLSIHLDNLGPQFFEYKKIGQITLNRTSITGMLMVFIYDSAVTVTNSSVWLAAVFNSDIHVSDSIVARLERIQNSSLFFERTVVEGIEFFYNDFFMYGNISFESTWSESIWFLSNVTRNFNFLAEDTGGNPMEGVELTLFDRNNTVVWSWQTHGSENPGFNVTFSDGNYTDTLRLEAVKGNRSATTSISFLSDTPVTLSLGSHDIATSDVELAKNVVGQGLTLPMNVTVMNKGDFAENFGVTCYANTTTLGTQSVFDLSNGTSTTLTFNWNTSGFAYGNYTITACAEPVPNEADTQNNNLTLGWVWVGLQGDIQPPFGTIDMKDVSYVARRFLCLPSDPLWDSNADVNGDGKIDMKDISTVARHFGEHYP